MKIEFISWTKLLGYSQLHWHAMVRRDCPSDVRSKILAWLQDKFPEGSYGRENLRLCHLWWAMKVGNKLKFRWDPKKMVSIHFISSSRPEDSKTENSQAWIGRESQVAFFSEVWEYLEDFGICLLLMINSCWYLPSCKATIRYAGEMLQPTKVWWGQL